jgi:hypothetical protein
MSYDDQYAPEPNAEEIAFIDGYDKGYMDGLRAYAHWKDGVEYVGTSGKSLEQAIVDRADSFNYNPSFPRGNNG